MQAENCGFVRRAKGKENKVIVIWKPQARLILTCG